MTLEELRKHILASGCLTKDLEAVNKIIVLSFEIVTCVRVEKLEDILKLGTEKQIEETIGIAEKIHALCMEREMELVKHLSTFSWKRFFFGGT
jgi:hypothetical protein